MKKKYLTWIRLLILLFALGISIVLFFSAEHQKKSYDENILFVVDISNSMNAQDISSDMKKISRLEAVKLMINAMIETEKNANFGLVMRGQTAGHYVPLTADTGTFLDYLKGLNSSLLPWGGTDRNALADIFSGNTMEYSKIIFFSDEGGKADGRRGLKGAERYVVGVGTEKGEWVRYANGKILQYHGDNVWNSYDAVWIRNVSNALHAKIYQIDGVDRIDSVISDVLRSSVSFSYAQIQILIVLLGIFILLAL